MVEKKKYNEKTEILLNKIQKLYEKSGMIDINFKDFLKKIKENSHLNILSKELINENNTSIEQLDIKKLYDILSYNIIGQEEAHKKILSTIWKNFSEHSDKAENIFVNGPTGVGKTETFQILANSIDVPIIFEDCTKFIVAEEEGDYVEKILTDLFIASNGNINKTAHGIVVLDNIDKLASVASDMPTTNEVLQIILLKMIDNYKYMINNTILETKDITFVALGNYSGIERMNEPILGFNSPQIRKEYKDINFNDINDFGIIPEFLRCFPTLISMKALTQNDMKKILLESANSPLINLKKYYKHYGVSFTYDNNTILEIVNKAIQYDTGARGLQTVLTDTTFEADMEIACNKIGTFKELIISAETINNPKKYILKK